MTTTGPSASGRAHHRHRRLAHLRLPDSRAPRPRRTSSPQSPAPSAASARIAIRICRVMKPARPSCPIATLTGSAPAAQPPKPLARCLPSCSMARNRVKILAHVHHHPRHQPRDDPRTGPPPASSARSATRWGAARRSGSTPIGAAEFEVAKLPGNLTRIRASLNAEGVDLIGSAQHEPPQAAASGGHGIRPFDSGEGTLDETGRPHAGSANQVCKITARVE